MTILKARKAMPSATAAAVTREPHGDAFHIRVSLMDDPSCPVEVIADFVTKQLGKDLTDAFGDKDVIILK